MYFDYAKILSCFWSQEDPEWLIMSHIATLWLACELNKVRKKLIQLCVYNSMHGKMEIMQFGSGLSRLIEQ